MPTVVQIRRGTTAENNNFIGQSGELTVDTSTWSLRVHDSLTPGGHAITGGVTGILSKAQGGTGTDNPVIANTAPISVTGTWPNVTVGITGTVSVTNGGTGTDNPVITSNAPISVTGTWPNVTVGLSGTVGFANGGTGVSTTPGQNQVLLGDGSKYNLTTLRAGTGVNFDQTNPGVLTINSSASSGSGNTITLADLPPGTVQWFAMQAAPAGWLECDGRSLSKTVNSGLYAALWTAIGYTYGGSADSFNLPDLRGQFLRGWDHGRGLDTGRAFGSVQTDAFKAHTHQIAVTAATQIVQTGTIGGGGGGTTGIVQIAAEGASGAALSLNASSSNYTSTATGGTETRPTNVALLPCIKFTSGIGANYVSNVNVTSGVNAFTFSGGPITSAGIIQLNTNGGSNTTFLRGDGTWDTPAISAVPNVQVITSTVYWIVPPGVNRVKVLMIGGGGGGGSGGSNGRQYGQYGGTGGQAIAIIPNLIPGANIQVTIGAGGIGSTFGSTNYGNSPQQNATAGNATIFGSYVTCNGGAAGSYSASPSFAATGTVTTAAGVTLLSNYYTLPIKSFPGQSQTGGVGATGGNASGYGAGGGGGDTNDAYYIGQYGGGRGSPGLVIIEY